MVVIGQQTWPSEMSIPKTSSIAPFQLNFEFSIFFSLAQFTPPVLPVEDKIKGWFFLLHNHLKVLCFCSWFFFVGVFCLFLLFCLVFFFFAKGYIYYATETHSLAFFTWQRLVPGFRETRWMSIGFEPANRWSVNISSSLHNASSDRFLNGMLGSSNWNWKYLLSSWKVKRKGVLKNVEIRPSGPVTSSLQKARDSFRRLRIITTRCPDVISVDKASFVMHALDSNMRKRKQRQCRVI